MTYTIKHIQQIIGGKWIRFSENTVIAYLVTDSRKLIFPDRSLFFALSGFRRDGHQFIPDLYAQGVRNFVVSVRPAVNKFPAANFILVKDTLAALQDLAAYHRRQFSFPVIGITGSNGKTIVKEWLNQMLEDRFNIVRSPASYNSQIGVPLSVWQMQESNELALFEAGISQAGEMRKLEKIIRPTLGILTNIGEAHSEGFRNSAQKIGEKLRLFDRADTLISPADDPVLRKEIGRWKKGRKIKWVNWGKSKTASLQIRSVKKQGNTSSIKLKWGKKEKAFQLPFTDQASIDNILTCITLLLTLDTPEAAIQLGIERLTAVSMRLEWQQGINGCAVINDSYSADLSSLKIALDFLAQQNHHPKKTVIISDILQSGKEEKKLYREIAALLAQAKVNRLIGIGKNISANADVFESLKSDAHFFESTEAFIAGFRQFIFRDETILLKGARVYAFEKIDRLLSLQAHQTVLEINLNAMANNLRQYQSLLKPETRVMAMVKAFAYGTGSFEIANALQYHRVDYLAVAYADEGVELRRSGIRLPILVMNPEDNNFAALAQHNLEPVLYSLNLLHSLEAFLRREGITTLPVHIEIESGMNRLGFSPAALDQLIHSLQRGPFVVQSVFSHLAASEEAGQDRFTQQQAEIFLRAANRIQEGIGYKFLRHIANSAAIIRHPELQLDMVRLGIGLYGVDSTLPHHLKLTEVATLKSTIAQIKHLHDGETVGYNRKAVIGQPTVMATVRIGYADGYPRSLGNGQGKMIVGGRLAPTLGSICMDMTMIDITGIPEVREGDEVIVFGNDLSIVDLARWAGTIPYEILTGVSQRVKRVYFQD